MLGAVKPYPHFAVTLYGDGTLETSYFAIEKDVYSSGEGKITAPKITAYLKKKLEIGENDDPKKVQYMLNAKSLKIDVPERGAVLLDRYLLASALRVLWSTDPMLPKFEGGDQPLRGELTFSSGTVALIVEKDRFFYGDQWFDKPNVGKKFLHFIDQQVPKKR